MLKKGLHSGCQAPITDKKPSLKSVVLFLTFLFFSPMICQGATIDVVGEVNTADSNLSVNIYASTAVNILSFGVKLTYSATDLSLTSVERNDAIWYFGNTATTYPYITPDTSTGGQVIIIGGLLNTGNPTGGVTGERILLATVTFNRLTAHAPALSLSYARLSPYKNFVGTNGTVYDDASQGVSFSTTFGTVCPQCTGDPVLLQDVTFEAGLACECKASTLIRIGPDVTIKKGVNITFTAPKIEVKPGTKIEPGAVVNMRQD